MIVVICVTCATPKFERIVTPNLFFNRLGPIQCYNSAICKVKRVTVVTCVPDWVVAG